VAALAEVYRRFSAAAPSPLYARVALALSESEEALRVLGRRPAAVLAALHDLALAGEAPALAAAYASGDGDAAARAAVDAVLRMPDLAARRPLRPDETGRYAVLHPAVAEVARRVRASTVGLVDVGRAAGLNVNIDRVGITYDNGQALGDPTSPAQVSAAVVGGRPVPAGAVPEVVARVVVDRDPVSVTDAEDVRWLRACVPPERVAALDAELAAAAPSQLLRGDPVELLPAAVARVPADALPVVTTTWTLSTLPLDARLRFLHRLDDAAERPVAWVSVEGVGVAPSVPTFGDRRASGHSIIGLTVLERSALRTEAVGRCWSRGRLLAWLA